MLTWQLKVQMSISVKQQASPVNHQKTKQQTGSQLGPTGKAEAAAVMSFLLYLKSTARVPAQRHFGRS